MLSFIEAALGQALFRWCDSTGLFLDGCSVNSDDMGTQGAIGRMCQHSRSGRKRKAGHRRQPAFSIPRNLNWSFLTWRIKLRWKYHIILIYLQIQSSSSFLLRNICQCKLTIAVARIQQCTLGRRCNLPNGLEWCSKKKERKNDQKKLDIHTERNFHLEFSDTSLSTKVTE